MLRKNKLYSVLNILGLAVGIACCLLISFWATDELGFDRFHENGDRIYRVNKVYTPATGGTELHALTPGPFGPALMAEHPEVESAIRIMPAFGNVLLSNGDNTLSTGDVLFADANLLDVFSFDLMRGDPETALVAPLSIVLSESLADALFGGQDPVGQTLVGIDELDFTVTGVVEDVPARSHLRYKAFVSWSSVETSNDALNFAWLERWLPQSIFTYVLLRPGALAETLDSKLPAFLQSHLPERVDQYRFYLQPLSAIYLGSRDIQHQRSMVQGSDTSVRILGVVGILILLVACVNFMNLATAQAGRRAMEVGVRKAMGARRGQLVSQFLSEAFLLVGSALIIALGIVETARPAFNGITGKEVASFVWLTPNVAIVLVVLGLTVGFVAGLYPAFVLTRFEPTSTLKGTGFAAGGQRLRSVLVITQFAASIVLLVGTAVVYRQMNFVQTQDPGYDREHVVIIPTGPTEIGGQLDAFKAELVRDTRILSATATNSVPGEALSSYSIRPEGTSESDGLIGDAIFLGDSNLLSTYGMSMAEGRFIDADRPGDSLSVVINEAMMRSLGWTSAVGKGFEVSDQDDGTTVVGVIKDFQVASMHQAITPLFIAFGRARTVSVRIAAVDVAGALAHIRQTWEQFESRYPFEYFFLDDSFARLYEIDRKLMKTLAIFAVLAILVACLGLFGLATYAAERRMKEIGVRKVLGASVSSVVTLLSKDFARLILFAFVIAAPIAFLATQRWLDGFAYRISIGAAEIALTGGLVFLVAIATVSTQAFRAANADPVKTLRYE